MKAILLKNPIEVANRLAELGWKKEDLIEVVDAMEGARNSCTENDPPSAPGWKSWCDGTRRLREIGSLHGLERCEDDHISSVFDKERGIKIAVVNTDDGTGIENRHPQNRSKKGAATDRAVSNNQGVLPNILDDANNVIQLQKPSGGVVYWYLCVYCEGDVVRAELSCPLECENGFFKSFHERILLISGDDDNTRLRILTDSPTAVPDFEINVKRKQA